MTSSPACRICGGLTDNLLSESAPALTSMQIWLDIKTHVEGCARCGHFQSPDLPDIRKFYDEDYRISLQSEAHDQLYTMIDDQPVYRTDFQAQLVFDTVDLPTNPMVLDFGAAKAETLRKLCLRRPDISPHVYDVSDSYLPFWESWIPQDQQATHALPENWKARFDLVTAHFVVEHLSDPVGVLKSISQMLKPTGHLFLTVPDPLANMGDLLVVDHLNHFTRPSLGHLLAQSGLNSVACFDDLYRGAFVSLSTPGSGVRPSAAAGVTAYNCGRSGLFNWSSILSNISEISDWLTDRWFAIYGAGFYGSLLAGKLATKPQFFLDRNPHLVGSQIQGVPVIHPDDMPTDLDAIVCGLNPEIARSIVGAQSAWLKGTPDIIYLDSEFSPTRATA